MTCPRPCDEKWQDQESDPRVPPTMSGENNLGGKLVLCPGRGDCPEADEVDFLLISNFLSFLDSGFTLMTWQKLHN